MCADAEVTILQCVLRDCTTELRDSRDEVKALEAAHAQAVAAAELAEADLVELQAILKAEGGKMSRGLHAQLRTIGAGSKTDRVAALQVCLKYEHISACSPPVAVVLLRLTLSQHQPSRLSENLTEIVQTSAGAASRDRGWPGARESGASGAERCCEGVRVAAQRKRCAHGVERCTASGCDRARHAERSASGVDCGSAKKLGTT